MKLYFGFAAIFILSINIACPPKLLAANEAYLTLKSYLTPDPCDTSFDNSYRKVTVSINLGPIYYADSLYTFEVTMKCDTNLLYFDKGLFGNTLSENMETKRFRYFQDGTISCDGGNSTVQVAGDKPLMAFSGYYKGNCLDSTVIQITSAYFGEEFKKNIPDTNYKLTILPQISNKAERKLTSKFEKDTLKDFGSDSIAQVNILFSTISYSNIKSFDINFDISQLTDIEILKFYSLDTNKIKIVSTTSINNNLKAKIVVNDFMFTNENLTLEFKRLKGNNKIYELPCTITDINNCNCIKSILTNKLYVKNKPDSISNYYEEHSDNVENKVSNFSSMLEFENYVSKINDQIKYMIFYNLEGREIVKIRNEDFNSIIKLDSFLYEKIFFVYLQKNNDEIKKFVLINN